jgi:hypothetical protein
MIGFVVQNFFTKNFLLKTQKYNALILSQNTKLIFLFIKRLIYVKFDFFNNINISIKYRSTFYSIFIKPFWKFFRQLKSHNFGLITINLTKSYYYEIFNHLNLFLTPQSNINQYEKTILKRWNVLYSKPVGALPFSFQ